MDITFKLTILFLVLFIPLISRAKDVITVLPDSPLIQYSGRIDFSNPKVPRFDWSGVSITVKFKGASIGFLLQDGKNNYEVKVDGHPVAVWVTRLNQELYTLSGLPNQKHIVQVIKRTEPLYGIGIFKGLVLDKSGVLLEPPAKPTRRIEFIGDSIVCGYGNESTTLKCGSLRPYENADKAFGPETARALKAEYVLVAYSGKGVVRNWGDKNKRSTDPFPTLYNRALCADKDSRWDYSKWVPDAVVIHLGQNDFSSEPRADSKDFIQGYIQLLKEIRGHYPDTFIYCFPTTGWPNYSPYVEEVIKERHEAGDKQVYFAGYPNFPVEDLGCDYHPQAKAHKKMAEILVPVMKDTLGW